MGWAEPSQVRAALAARPRAVCAVMRAETREGVDKQFQALLGEFAHRVRADEAGCESYLITRAMGSGVHYVIHARFVDWAAFEDHPDTLHFKRFMPRLNALLASPVAMEIFLEI